MDPTVSVSKGCFVFNPSSAKKKNNASKIVENEFQGNIWYKSYKTLLNSVDKKLQDVYDNVYTEVLKDLVQYVEHSHSEPSETIPVAALLTGINMPDHAILFERLSSLLHDRVTPHVATLHARDCTTVRASVEQIVSQLINQPNNDACLDDSKDIVKKQQCNFIALEAWYRDLVSKHSPSKKSRSTETVEAKSPSKVWNGTSELKSPLNMTRSLINDGPKSPSKMLRSSNIGELKSPLKVGKESGINELKSPSKMRTSVDNHGSKSPAKISRSCKIDELKSPTKMSRIFSDTESKSPAKTRRSVNSDELSSPSKMSRRCNVDQLKSPSKISKSLNFSEMKTPTKLSSIAANIEVLKSPSIMKNSNNDDCKSPFQRRVTFAENSKASSLKRSMPLRNVDDCTDRESRPIIVVVIPEFEGFNNKVLQNLLTIASYQTSALPITFVFGVATSVQALQRGLSYRVSSKLSIEVFHSQKSINFLDHVLEQILLNDSSPFHLGGKTFRLFCEVFLYYDFSVEGFIQHLKYCLMEHFYGRNVSSLCCTPDELDANIAALSRNDLADLRKVPSFQKYLESASSKEAELLRTNDKHLKNEVSSLVRHLYNHLSCFYVILRVVHVLCSTLPNAPLGQQIRKIYEKAISGKIYETKEYKECMKLLGFQSREELLEKLLQVMTVLSAANSTSGSMPFTDTITSLQLIYERLKSSGISRIGSPTKSPMKSPKKNASLSLTDSAGKRIGRTQFLQNVLVSGKTDRPMSEYEQARHALVDCLSTCLPPFLAPLTSMPLHELVLFDDVQTVKVHLVGAPRAAIHMALNDPHYYLQCDCCSLPSTTAILESLPDVCIAYKLHLECGKLINLYDWLQSFAAIVSPDAKDDTDDRQICPEIQARFASAVAELQFLGFIKSSKKKTDHVTRLTFNPK